MLWAVSRAPTPSSTPTRRMGWTFPWASSFGSDFNHDFSVGFTEQEQREGQIEYNYNREEPMRDALVGKKGQRWRSDEGEGTVEWMAARTGTDVATYTRERPGISAFALEEGVVYHTYSSASPADSTRSGGCTSGSTGRRRDATRPTSGSAATTSTRLRPSEDG